MKKIRVMQVGLGPLGQNISKMIAERNGFETVAAVDLSPELTGQDLGELTGLGASGILISNDLNKTIETTDPDIALVTTVSDMKRMLTQLEDIVDYGLPVVSTCEELSFPWKTFPEEAKKIDELAKENGVAILGTGVNPGFLMDALPKFLSSVAQEVEHIQVERVQNASVRRLPFQQKIGAGLSLKEFDEKKTAGTLRHVGLTESMYMLAHQMGWNVDSTEDKIEPVLDGDKARGVKQTGIASEKGVEKIRLVFHAAVEEPQSFDKITIKGQPNITSTIEGGVQGDIATGAIVINSISKVIDAKPGLRTMADIELIGFSG